MTPQLLETVTTRANAQIDPSLHVWGFEITIYLFLGGIVAGIFILTAALELVSARRGRSRALRPMPFAALALLSVGMLALWLDLAHRLWAWRFYAVFRPTSPMSWGAWILVLIYPAGLLFGLGSLDAAQRAWLGARTPAFLRGLLARLTGFADAHRRAVLVTSVLMGVGLGLYTGLLLGTMPSRLAWNSAVLGPLFLASGISTGAAFLLLFTAGRSGAEDARPLGRDRDRRRARPDRPPPPRLGDLRRGRPPRGAELPRRAVHGRLLVARRRHGAPRPARDGVPRVPAAPPVHRARPGPDPRGRPRAALDPPRGRPGLGLPASPVKR